MIYIVDRGSHDHDTIVFVEDGECVVREAVVKFLERFVIHLHSPSSVIATCDSDDLMWRDHRVELIESVVDFHELAKALAPPPAEFLALPYAIQKRLIYTWHEYELARADTLRTAEKKANGLRAEDLRLTRHAGKMKWNTFVKAAGFQHLVIS